MMGAKIKQANMKRLASLSALGAGALGASAVNADASSIVFSGPVEVQIGLCPGCRHKAVFTGPNGAGGAFAFYRTFTTDRFSRFAVSLADRRGAHGTYFRAAGAHILSAFPIDAKWSDRKSFPGPWNVAALTTVTRYYTASTRFHGKDKYLLFTFAGGQLPQTLYGWAQLRVSFGPPNEIDVTLVDWAYDTSGAQIPAGDTGAPEPSTFVLTGLAALALGAKGLRAWRAARSSG
jgi:hypothetical protein